MSPSKVSKITQTSRSTKTKIIPGEKYLPTVLDLIANAESSIDILAYSFAIGSAAGKLNTHHAPYEIAEAIAAKKKELGKKIKIRLYIEGQRETSERNWVTAEFLKKAGVEVKYGATHAKGFCFDNKFLLFGSTNLTHQSITKNLEMNLLMSDHESIKSFELYFEHQWRGGKHGGVKLPPPLLADGAFKDSLIALIDRAKQTLEFSIYFFHHTEIENALIRASLRGVKITGLIHHHTAFALSYVKRTRGTADRLQAKGITDLHLGPSYLFTHSKFIIRDKNEILLGTGNWLHEDVKVHPQLYVHLKDSSLAKRLSLELKKQISTSGEALFQMTNKPKKFPAKKQLSA